MTESHILSYGADKRLLTARAMVLEAAGYQVYTASRFGEMRRILEGVRIDLLILCHSLSDDECMEAAACAHATSEGTKVLLLFGARGALASDASIDSLDEVIVSPRILLSKVASSLGAAEADNPNKSQTYNLKMTGSEAHRSVLSIRGEAESMSSDR